jgi:hypothetical protein
MQRETRALTRASAAIAALPDPDRRHLFELVRGASAIPLTDHEVERIAAILWADRGPGIVQSLESGYQLFQPAPDPPKGARRRPVTALPDGERQALLSSLLAERHVPPPAKSD